MKEETPITSSAEWQIIDCDQWSSGQQLEYKPEPITFEVGTFIRNMIGGFLASIFGVLSVLTVSFFGFDATLKF